MLSTVDVAIQKWAVRPSPAPILPLYCFWMYLKILGRLLLAAWSLRNWAYLSMKVSSALQCIRNHLQTLISQLLACSSVLLCREALATERPLGWSWCCLSSLHEKISIRAFVHPWYAVAHLQRQIAWQEPFSALQPSLNFTFAFTRADVNLTGKCYVQIPVSVESCSPSFH